MTEQLIDGQLVLYGRKYSSRLLLGTPRYESPSVLADAVRAHYDAPGNRQCL